MTSVTTHKLELTHHELSLVIRGLRAVKSQIDLHSLTLRGAGTAGEADEVEQLRLRLTVIYGKKNIPPYPAR